MWLAMLIVIFALITVDAFVRTILMLRLGKQIDRKGDYRERHHEIGKGNKPYVITLLGASSMYGEGSSVNLPFVDALADQLAKQGHRVVVDNLAISGHRVVDVTTKQVPYMKKSDLILVYAGTKDCLTLTPTRKYLSALHDLAKALRGKTVTWVTIGDPRLMWLVPIWIRWLFYFRAKKFTTLLKQVVAEHSTEQWQVADFFNEGMAEAKRRRLNARQVVEDGVHLSDEGQKLMSDFVMRSYTSAGP